MKAAGNRAKTKFRQKGRLQEPTKITISIQWDHREARSKKNSGSPINSYGMLNFESQEELSHYEAVSLSHSSARWSQDQKYSLPPATESWKKESKWQFIWKTQSKQ
ncbi:hypothetical protein Tco_0557384 [Tanacetum coccineum]